MSTFFPKFFSGFVPGGAGHFASLWVPGAFCGGGGPDRNTTPHAAPMTMAGHAPMRKTTTACAPAVKFDQPFLAASASRAAKLVAGGQGLHLVKGDVHGAVGDLLAVPD